MVVFDQLEELFTTNPQHWPDRKGFFENVAGACARMPDLNVPPIIRETTWPSSTVMHRCCRSFVRIF